VITEAGRRFPLVGLKAGGSPPHRTRRRKRSYLPHDESQLATTPDKDRWQDRDPDMLGVPTLIIWGIIAVTSASPDKVPAWVPGGPPVAAHR